KESESGHLNTFDAFPKRLESAATGWAGGASPHLRFKNREREGHADAVFAATAGAWTGGHCARTDQRRRTQPPGRNQRVDERSIYRRTLAVCFATKWDADVQHPDSGAGLDGTTEK